MHRARLAALVAVAAISIPVLVILEAPTSQAQPAPSPTDRPSDRCPSPPPGTPNTCPLRATVLSAGAASAESREVTDGRAHIYAGIADRPFWYVYAAVSTSAGFDADVQTGQYPLDREPVSISAAADTATAHVVDWTAWDFNGGRAGQGWLEADIVSHQALADGAPVQYLAQFAGTGQTLAVDATSRPVGFANEDWLVDVRDLRLTAGTTVTFTVSGDIQAVSIVRSVAGQPGTFHRARNQAVASRTIAKGATGVLSYAVPADGWYGVVFEARDHHGTGTVKVR